ncbi:hypothetical protein [Xenorhabdus doucetiae]|uniref:hypothetical protein n=1 Tax=Xenorhabdus doucetiae TaxID=351671 RepID=UPI002B40807F|nr:hypothetical protein [Xenorhabdus sp. 3]
MAKRRKHAVVFHTAVPEAQQSVFHAIYRWLAKERKVTVIFCTVLAVPTKLFFIQHIGGGCFLRSAGSANSDCF